jgi:Ca-activated chloride channel family protein
MDQQTQFVQPTKSSVVKHISAKIVSAKPASSQKSKKGRDLCMYLIFLGSVFAVQGQTEALDQIQKDTKEAAAYLSKGSEGMQRNQFVTAEAAYRKAIAIQEKKTTGNYNLGNAYYKNSKNGEALARFVKAANNATSKGERHQAFHNLGNALMNKKDYTGAVEAYKNALRNNPADDQTRYNLALAKDMLEKNPPEEGGDDENKDQDQKDEEDKEDQKEKENDQDKEEGDDKDDSDKEEGEDEDDKDKEGDQEDDKGRPDEPEDPKEEQGKADQQEQQPVPGKLSPQEVQNLLESMNNEEKKVQDKINAKKQKGAKVKSEKDW